MSTLHCFHYTAGTTSLLDVYTDRSKTTTAAQPVVSDSNGIVSFYADGNFKFVLKDGSDSTTLYTYDNWNVADNSGALSGEGAALTAASTLTLGTDGNQFHVAGSTGIAAISGTQPEVTLIFDSTPTLTHSGNLILENTTDFTASAGDVLTFMNEGSGVWREISRRYALRSSYLYARDEQGLLENLTLTASVSAKALTIALKTKAAADPATTDPVRIAFRSATLTTGTYAVRSVTAATSVTVPSTATLGFTANLASRIYIVALDNAGTVELAVWHPLNPTGPTILGLSESSLYSSTAIGTGSDSAQTLYSTSARSNVAIRVLGYIEITTGAVAGEWDNEDTVIQVMGPGVKRTGDLVQKRYTATGAVATGSTDTPVDDTPPEITEGDQYMSIAITPTSSLNLLRIEAKGNVATTTDALLVTGALHQVGVTNALGAVHARIAGTGVGGNASIMAVPITHVMAAGSASAITFSYRVGENAGAATVTFNGSGGGRIYGGVINSYMSVEEIFT